MKPLVCVWTLCLLLPSLLAGSPAANERRAISLAGKWRFRIDRQDQGEAERWFDQTWPDGIPLPGAMAQYGYGDDVRVDTQWTGQIVDRSWFTAPEYEKYRQPGNLKIPFWLQPDKHYVGPAWYQREVEIPADWQGRRIVLTFERPHWETRVWLDGRPLGTNNALSTPHEYSLGTTLAAGKHRLSVRVDNRLVVDVGINSHSVSDHTQGNWNGVVGRLELAATAPVWFEDLQAYPHPGAKSVTIKGRLGNVSGQAGQGTVTLEARGFNTQKAQVVPAKTIHVSWQPEGGEFETEYSLGEQARLWDEFDPALYRLTASLDPGREAKSVSFGLREIGTQGTQFLINGRKLFIRGTLECAIFPATGYPPTETEAWRRIIRIAKAHGLNNIRFHSWCPPEAAFIAADELGFYYQVECASWANTTTRLGEGLPIDRWLYEETDRILKFYGNHPSFLLMPYGNEPAGDDKRYLGAWVNHYKKKDPRRLYTSASGWPQIPENQFHVSPDPRVQAWGGGLKSRINALPPETRTDYRDYIRQRSVPVISHEIGQWCVYPNFAEMPKYTGYLKPKNFEIFQESLAAHRMADQARDFLLASGKLQTLCYKEDIESALRTPGMGGFQLLDLHDFPGQGTALVGVLDPFWDSKGYVTAAEFRRFCNSTVPLARLSKRVWTTDETLEAELEVAHFGPRPWARTATEWRLVGADGKAVAKGKLPARDIPVDNGIALGRVTLPLSHVPAPRRYTLVARLAGTAFENDWDLWVYPAKLEVPTPPRIRLSQRLDDQALAALDAGEKVLLLVPPGRARGDKQGKVGLGFSSIFWNTAWTGRQLPHTLGILCDPRHPALAAFPTENHSNWQWWHLISQAQALILEDLPGNLRPIVQVVDDWVTNRRLGLVFEARLGGGKLLVCAIDLTTAPGQNPVSRQMLHSLLRYMDSPRFAPATEVTREEVNGLFAPPE